MTFYVPERVNPYSKPEACGLRIVDTFEDPQADYSFDIVVVWEDDDGNFYWDRDAGCSCPAPFEEYENWTAKALPPLTEDTLKDFEEAVRAVVGYDRYTSTEKADAEQFIQDIRMTVRGLR